MFSKVKGHDALKPGKCYRKGKPLYSDVSDEKMNQKETALLPGAR